MAHATAPTGTTRIGTNSPRTASARPASPKPTTTERQTQSPTAIHRGTDEAGGNGCSLPDIVASLTRRTPRGGAPTPRSDDAETDSDDEAAVG